jgi:hypothetical protein
MTLACLIISYARKDNVLQLVEEVFNSGIEKIYISIDGPRNQEVESFQLELKSDLAKWNGLHLSQIQIWQRKKNFGSGASVIASLDWVFANEEEVIVLEDDLEVREQFFNFMKFGLQQMKNHSNLKIVTGTNPFPEVTQNRFGKVHYPVAWGWATNRANWLELRKLLFGDFPTKSLHFHLNKDLYWRIGKKRALKGQIEAWDVPLASEMYKTPYYTLLPPSNLVRNIGFDRHAAHTSAAIWPLNLSIADYSVPENSELKPLMFVDLGKEFENKIFKIRLHHIVSWILHKTIDRYRFKPEVTTLQDRVLMEGYPSK